MSYTGKQFEQDFAASFDKSIESLTLLRLHDSVSGFKGIKNPCDFIMGTAFGTGYIELKTTKSASLPFSNITDMQWNEMTIADYSLYTFCGVLVYFQKHGLIKWYPIRELNSLKKAGAKSVNPENLAEVGFSVNFKKKRTRLTIDFESLVEAFRQDWEAG